jgi:hypothetical protein
VDEKLLVTVCAVNDEDSRLNFNFVTESLPESWCLGPLKNTGAKSPSVGQRLSVIGRWVQDASGSRMLFFANVVD